MKKYIIFFIGILFLFACSNNNNVNEHSTVSNDNALLAKKVEVQNRITLKNEDNPDWVSSFDNVVFFKDIFDKIFSGEFTDCYKNRRILSDTSKYSAEEVKERMVVTRVYNKITNQKDTLKIDQEPDFSQLKEIFFDEEWNFNSEKLFFEKKINMWSPIRVYQVPGDAERNDTRYKMVTTFRNNKETGNKKIIAENYTYIFEFTPENLLDRTGLDKNNFFNFLFQNIKTGKIKTYDPIYLVDNSKREFSVEQLKNFAGISLDPEEFSNEVDKMIFIEDLYFDEKTFNFSKKVKGIGFIADRYNDGWEEKILFFIFFE